MGNSGIRDILMGVGKIHLHDSIFFKEGVTITPYVAIAEVTLSRVNCLVQEQEPWVDCIYFCSVQCDVVFVSVHWYTLLLTNLYCP